PVSTATGEQALQRGLAAEKLHVVPNGVDVARLTPGGGEAVADGRAVLHQQVPGLPAEGFLLLSVGRQVERKGFAPFVEQVLPRLPADVHYVLAGEGPEA